MHVEQPSRRTSYELFIGPLCNPDGLGAIVFIRDPENQPLPDASRLIANDSSGSQADRIVGWRPLPG